jgi:hypothetical protein
MPLIFCTTAVWPIASWNYLAKTRLFKSLAPPARAGTIRVTGLVGQSVVGASEVGASETGGSEAGTEAAGDSDAGGEDCVVPPPQAASIRNTSTSDTMDVIFFMCFSSVKTIDL